MPTFRALLFVFAVAVVALVTLSLVRRDRKYLRWAGRLFAAGLAAALLFFAVLLIQRFT